jgi:hypothetical protein
MTRLHSKLTLMANILVRLPIPMRDEVAFVGEEHVRLKEAEIIVWVSVAEKRAGIEPNPNVPRFPAILDTGHTHNFSIQEQHLIRWAGIRPESLPTLGNIRQAGKRIPLHAANVWLHSNQPGRREVAASRPPLLLELPRGIAVYADTEKYPRLPLLGLRAIISNRLHLAIDGEQSTVNLRTADWWTWLIRWLF